MFGKWLLKAEMSFFFFSCFQFWGVRCDDRAGEEKEEYHGNLGAEDSNGDDRRDANLVLATGLCVRGGECVA